MAQTEITDSMCCSAEPAPRSTTAIRLQIVTLAWMSIECGVALLAAKRASSASLLAFGSDSFVELLSAAIVLGQFLKITRVSERTATRLASVLLFSLALVVVLVAVLSLRTSRTVDTSWLGIGVTGVALILMPMLGWLKRREAKRLNNRALAADAVQSATCAFLAAITLLGLVMNAYFHIGWIDSLAALAAIPILFKEGKEAWQGKSCC